MLGVTLIKLTDTDNDACFINLDKVNMILTDSISKEASIYLEEDKALVVKMDSFFKILEEYIVERSTVSHINFPPII